MQLDLPDTTPVVLSTMVLKETSEKLTSVLTMCAISDDQKFTANAVKTVIDNQNELISNLLASYLDMVDTLGEIAALIPE